MPGLAWDEQGFDRADSRQGRRSGQESHPVGQRSDKHKLGREDSQCSTIPHISNRAKTKLPGRARANHQNLETPLTPWMRRKRSNGASVLIYILLGLIRRERKVFRRYKSIRLRFGLKALRLRTSQ